MKKGFNDSRGGLIFKIADICKHHKPSTVILENVYNLITFDKGKSISRIKKLFEEIGYNVIYKKLNSCDFGLAQSRERVYIVCTLNSKPTFENLVQSDVTVHVKNIIDHTDMNSNIDNKDFVDKIIKLHKKNPIHGCKIGDKRGGKNNIHSWDIGYNGVISQEERDLMKQIMLERRKKHWAEKKGIKWMDGMPLTEEEIKTFFPHKDLSKMLSNLLEKKYLRLEKCKDLVDGKRVYKESSQEGYNICKGKLSFPISKILNPDDVSPTLTATDSHKLVIINNDTCLRSLNAKELKKLCGFPNDVNMYDLFGNMATPPVIQSILKLVFG